MHENHEKYSLEEDDFSGEPIVSSNIPMHQRENGEFHFLMHHSLKNMGIIQTQEDSDQVIYCGPKSLDDSQEIVFPNHGLAQQNRHLPHHLTIPKISKDFPTHITLIYIPEGYHEDQRDFIVVHVNCTHHAMSQSVTAQAYSYHAGFHRVGLGQKIAMSSTEQASARQDAKPLYNMYQEILHVKAEVYAQFYQQSFQIDHDLAKLRAQQSDRVLIRAKALELQEISNKLSLYHGAVRDSRANLMSHLLRELETAEIHFEPLSVKDTGVEGVFSEKNKVNSIVNITKSKVEAQTAYMQDMKLKIQQQIDTMRSVSASPLTPTFVEEWLQLELMFDQLIFATPSNKQKGSKNFIIQQRTYLALQTSLLDHFSDCIRAGDVLAVKTMFPIIECRYDLSVQFSDLIKHMFYNTNRSLTMNELPQIGHFFYEHSEAFRCLLQITILCMIQYTNGISEGVAYRCFASNNLQLFQLALKVIQEDHAQLSSQDNQYYGILEAIVRNYKTNPNVQFIQALLPVLGNIRVQPIHSVRVQVSQQELRNPAKLKKIHHKELAQLDVKVSLTSQELNAFELASALAYEVYPELMQELVAYASLKSLVLVYAEIVNEQCIARLIPGPQPMLYSTANQTTCELIHSQIGSIHTQTLYCCFLFYLKESGEKSPNSAKILQSLQAVSKHFQVFLERQSGDIFARDAQLRKTMHHLSASQNGNKLLAAQFCYGFINQPTIGDHEAMLRLFTLRGKRLVEQSRNPIPLYCNQMSQFLDMLSEDTLSDLGSRPIYAYAIKKLPDALQNRYSQYVAQIEVENKANISPNPK